MNKLIFIGNFVNDTIVNHKDLSISREQSFHDLLKSCETSRELNNTNVERNTALGGSVTYGSLASAAFGGTTSYIVTNLGTDIDDQYNRLICNDSQRGCISTQYVAPSATPNTAYQLNYYNNKKNRTLLLMEKGKRIDSAQCMQCLREQQPDAVFFVPVADEIDTDLIMDVLDGMKSLKTKPIIAFDIQGLLRTFVGTKVTTRPKDVMIERLKLIGNKLNADGFVSILKSEYGEAVAIVGDGHTDPATCSKLIRTEFGFTFSSVTMGGDGGFISSSTTGEVYIPTFKPEVVKDETGCGDTFLTCTILELLTTLSNKKKMTGTQNNASVANDSAPPVSAEDDVLGALGLTRDEIIHCIEVGSAGASFLVEQIGPNGFANRDRIIDRVTNGQRQAKSTYLQFNSPDQSARPSKPPKSTTHY
ncbi:hypothetical protein SAMD00019534_004510, partial [Acytostelium subglobosum LB1]|uniref:hypothetical protein n=1 Tax=Acytostelium subglobosum LB1 TaxID=1410327 RepID=UPI000644A2BD